MDGVSLVNEIPENTKIPKEFTKPRSRVLEEGVSDGEEVVAGEEPDVTARGFGRGDDAKERRHAARSFDSIDFKGLGYAVLKQGERGFPRAGRNLLKVGLSETRGQSLGIGKRGRANLGHAVIMDHRREARAA